VSRHDDIREECCAVNRALGASGLVDLTFGNASVLDRDACVFAVKPSGVGYDTLTPDDMVLVDLEGRVVGGALRPSSDTPTHAVLLAAFAGARSVIHTHSRHAVAFAQAERPIPRLGTTHADYFRGAVPLTRALTAEEIAADYEANTGRVILEAFAGRDPMDVPAVLVRHHGPFVWGASGAGALEVASALEIVAQMAAQTLALSPSAAGPGEALGEKHFTRKHGAAAYYGQPVPTTPEEIRRRLLRTPPPAPSRSASPSQS
jgi:L-ribulose-5-phosphate 4-epimerase